MISLKAFGKNDIRGIYGETVTEDLFYVVGKAYVRYVTERCNKNSVSLSVVRDARLHSETLAKALIKGVLEAGGNVIDLGMGPTPFGYFSEFADAEYGSLDGSLIVTASHNPPEYNGLKMTCEKQSLHEEQIKDVKAITEKILNGEIDVPKSDGKYTTYDMVKNYTDYQIKLYGASKKNVKIVTDCANAVAGVVAPQMLKACGYEVIELFTEPDGRFPNHHPNPSIESTLDTLKKTVLETGADVGIAFDGDADRIGVIDSDGNYLTGDKLLYIYSTDIIPKVINSGKPVIVSEVKCSQALFDGLTKLGAQAVMCRTGHGYIKAKMAETKAIAAGEMSGHMFFKDNWFGFDDAVFAASKLADLINRRKAENPNFKLSDLLEPFNLVYTSSEVRFPCIDEFKKPVLKKIEEKIEGNPDFFGDKIKDIIKLDGFRIVFDGGFAMIRQSNTEPVFTLRFEGKTKALCEQYMKAMLDELTNITTEMKA
ncbi:MAG: phosphomannomutase/phosphoglucomutase [Candidatus Gastranaerophilales bacterium]|nr:phosphomannomutase/phosphoglucomutase [Candidatus Gastranaerophilales bacterium]